MKQHLFALAGVVAATALATDPTPRPGDISLVGFENYTVNQGVAGYDDSGTATQASPWSGTGDATVRAYASGTAPSANLPPPFADSGSKYLEIDSGSDEVQRNIQGGTANNVYIDTLAQFSVLRAGEDAPTADNAKILLWLQEDTNNVEGVTTYTTNLYARGGHYGTMELPNQQVYKLNKTCEPNVWYRVTIRAYKTIVINEVYFGPEDTPVDIPAFEIMINGETVATEEPVYDGDLLNTLCPEQTGTNPGEDDCLSQPIFNLISNNQLIPALGGATATTVSQVAFKGTGAIDDFVVSVNNPAGFILSWPTDLTSVFYTVNGGTSVSPTIANGSVCITDYPDGATVSLTGSIGDYSRTVTTNITAGGTLALPASLINYFFPRTATAGQDGTAANPFEIADVDDLIALKDAVATLADARSLSYVQTADIDMASAGAFAGIGTYSANDEGDLKAGDPRGGVPFTGTYDGQGYKISNITLASQNYAGIFNQVNGGTIKNLTVENATGAKGISIVGNAGNGATLLNLTAAGAFGSAANPAGHNAAGIVIRASAGGTGTLISNCVNNATIYGTYTKLAGICVLTQTKVSGGAVTFMDCANNGDLYLDRNKNDITGFAGIVGYVQDDTILVRCSNTGTLHNTNNAANKDRDGALIGWAYGKALTDNGGNSAAKTDKMVGYQTAGTAGQSITGFKFATVANDVATTVLPPLAVGNTYLLEGNVAASETPVATLAFGQTISFDTALGYTFDGNVAAEAPLVAIPSTSGTVITFSTGYFPRTATAGQDGTAEHPFEIADEDDLQALQAYVTTTNCTGLAFVQVADIALTAAWPGIGPDGGKDLAADVYEAGAFAGTYDGGNYTISNFSMVDGVDYGGLFNSINNATIKNLKMSWGSSTLCSNSSSSGDDTGATFVGTAKGSTLQNLTALAGTVTTVSASKDMAGIVGFVYAGSTIEACTNELNITSFKTSRKCGGIAIITQSGSGNAIFRNCYNSGTVTTPGTAYREGGIVGYVNVATTIDGCENTANVKLFHVEGSPIVTVTGTNKGYAGVASNDKGVSGLYFATVDGDVATFVADDALALNGEYKVMSTGATATFAFAEAGTISFDTNLVQAVTFAITAAEELTLTDATANGVVTYTATGVGGDDDYVVTINGSDVVIAPSAEDLAAVQAAVIASGGTLDVTDVAAVNAALAAEIGSTGIPSWQALFLGLPPTEAGLESFKIASISFNGDGNVVLTLPAAVSPKTGRGVNIALNLMGSNDLSNWTFIEAAGGQDGKTFAPVVPALGETKKFYKVVAVFTATAAE